MNLTTQTDNELMVAVRDGQLTALGELFQRYKRVLWTYFFRLCKDQMLSEDLVQNVLNSKINFEVMDHLNTGFSISPETYTLISSAKIK